MTKNKKDQKKTDSESKRQVELKTPAVSRNQKDEDGKECNESQAAAPTRRQKKNMKMQQKKQEGQQSVEQKDSCKTSNFKSSKKESTKNLEEVSVDNKAATEVSKKSTEPKTEAASEDATPDRGKAEKTKSVESKDSIPYKRQAQNKTRSHNEKSKFESDNFDYYNNIAINPLKNNANKTDDKKLEESHKQPSDLSPNHSNSRNDKDFDTFEKLLKERHFKESNYKKIQEIQKDLFDMPPTYSLAHCVAEDMNMGSGIAVQFSQKFKSRDKLYDQRQRQGGLAVLPDDNRYIYYLVTKRLSNGKPTMYTMWNSLQKLQQHMHENDVKALAIPRIGCGLDRLEWSAVKAMIEYTFKDTNMEITVCNFQQPEEDAFVGRFQKQSKCLLKNVSYPLVDIETMTAIVYFGTEDGHISDDLESLDTKFHIIGEYTRATRKLGEIIQTPKHNQEYILFGCIVRKSQNEQFDFIQFQKCVYQIKKSIKSKYGYVAIQAFLDNKDDLILNKIINMLRFSLIKVEVYVCWGGKMLSYMPAERGGDY